MKFQIREGQKALQNAQSSGMSAHDGIWLYNVVTPARTYVLLLDRWDDKELTKIQAAPIKILLSALQIRASWHRSLMQGTMKHGYANIQRWSTSITAQQCSRALCELNGSNRSSVGLRNLISHQQRDMETSTNFLSLDYTKWGSLLKPSWMTSLWKRLSTYNIKIEGGGFTLPKGKTCWEKAKLNLT